MSQPELGVGPARSRMSLRHVLLLAIVVLTISTLSLGQTASTGALTGVITDPTGAVIAGAQVKVMNEATGETRTLTSRADGNYAAPLLPPGKYKVTVSQSGFKTASVATVAVVVTETATANVQLQVGSASDTVEVVGAAAQVQTESAELGHVTTSEMIASLPLVTRNYTQIIALNPGISAEPNNAGALGRGNSAYGAGGGGFSAHGGTTNDNNFQMNGIEINDTMGSQVNSGGIAVPNPDTLQEFKVLTGQYDASYGRNAGANVNVITKSGSNQIHGTVFEYLRNDALNANEWYRNFTGAPRPVLKQNQFGATIGGPIMKDKFHYFGSYQGTRQRNGLSGYCSSKVYGPPLTNDRSRQALGTLFAGRYGYINTLLDPTGTLGPTILADGSNISAVGLALLNAKGPDGKYLIPTPQTITPSSDPLEFDTEGVTLYSMACPFTENQFMANLDYQQTQKSQWRGRFFLSNTAAVHTLRASSVFGGAGIPGFPFNSIGNYRNVSIENTYSVTNTLLNQMSIGYTRQHAGGDQTNPLSFNQLGISAPAVDDPPVIKVGGLSMGGYGQGMLFNQNTYVAQDQMVWMRGKQKISVGGGITRVQINEPGIKYSGIVYFASTADALLGLNAVDNGTAAAGLPYSNVLGTVEVLGPKAAFYRIWDGNIYLQDDFKLTQRFTLNMGLRFERLGNMSQPKGLMTSVDPALLNPTPPTTGTYAGYIVPSNYDGPMPNGVTKQDNNMGVRGIDQNTWNPRLGFAWQLPGSDRMVLRGGYGMFHMRTTGQGVIQGVNSPPWTYLRYAVETGAQTATAANPFPSAMPDLPYFPPITPTAGLAFEVLAQNFRPPTYQRWSLGIQTKLTDSMVLDTSYVGGRGTQLIRQRHSNQAMLASVTNPIRGVTTNTTANVSSRLPYQGFAPNGLELIENGAASWYNAFDLSLNKRFSHGLQFQGSYTFARALTDAPGIVADSIGGMAYGDQNDPKQHYGPDVFVREQRFVFSYVYALPGPKNLKSFLGRAVGGWTLSGVTVAQSGHRLTPTYSNSKNYTGLRYDRPNYTPGCSLSVSNGSVQDMIKNNTTYFNNTCFTDPTPLVAGVSATAFGNAPIGLIHGPRQVNFDTSLAKKFAVSWPNEQAFFEFRSDFFNALNHAQFADPVTSYKGGLAMGKMTGDTVTNPRIIQFALRLNF